MNNDVNIALVSGNLSADPIIKEVSPGRFVANFSVAANRYWKDKDGGVKQKTFWGNIEAWDTNAEVCKKLLQKGTKVLIKGENQIDSWKDPEGKPRSIPKIVAYTIEVLSNGKKFLPPQASTEETLN